jgi:hypothetical protein
MKGKTLSWLAIGTLAWASLQSARAIVVNTGADQTSDTVNASSWSTGWSGTGVDGWDYVGSLGSAGTGGGVYLGDGWVITAAHVGTGSGIYTLDGISYNVVTSSAQSIGGSDLTMFQISPASGSLPALAPLTLSSSTPAAGTQIVMIGYGAGAATPTSDPNHTWGLTVNGATAGAETWGVSTVTSTSDMTVNLDSWSSQDFLTTLDLNPHDPGSSAIVQGGDSGGGVFVYNTLTHSWELAGILEVLYTYNDQTADLVNGDETSMIDLSQYAGEIDAIMTPEPGVAALFGLGAVAGAFALRRRIVAA